MFSLRLFLTFLAIGLAAAGSSSAGTWNKVYLGTGHDFEKGGAVRSENYTIKFDEQFELRPDVAIALAGYDIDGSNPGVKAEISKITVVGFILTITVPENAKVYSLTVSWLATISFKIDITRLTIDASSGDYHLGSISEGKGERSTSDVIKHPKFLVRPHVAVFVSGFTFSGEGAVSFNAHPEAITHDDFKLVYGTTGDNKLLSIGLNIIHFEQGGGRSEDLTSLGTIEEEAPMAVGKGDRSFVSSVEIGGTDSSTLLGFNQFNFVKGTNARINQDMVRKMDLVTVTYSTSGSTQVINAKSSIFVSPTDPEVYESQSGRFNRIFAGTDHKFVKDASIERSSVIKITFPKPFRFAPKVWLGLNGFDLAYANTGVYADVKDITTTGFTATLYAQKGAIVNIIAASWFATCSPMISVSVLFKEVPDFQPTDGEQVLTYPITHPKNLKFPGVAVFFSGFEFGSSNDLHLKGWADDITGDGFNLKISSWGNAKLEGFQAVIVHFEKNAFQDKIEIQSQPMPGSGDRNNRQKGTVYPDSQFYVAVGLLDFSTGANYRLSQEFTLKESQLSANFITSQDTVINALTDVIFYSPLHPILPRPITLTGEWAFKYWTTPDHPFYNQVGDTRKDTQKIKFPIAFESLPRVALSLTGFDVNTEAPGVRGEVSDITMDGFTLTIIAPKGSQVWYAAFSWLATVSDSIEIQHLVFDAETSEDFAKYFQDTSKQTFAKTIAKPSKKWDNLAAVSVVSGFRFEESLALIFKTYVDNIDKDNGAEVVYGTWANSKLKGLDLTIILYDDNGESGASSFESKNKGPLYLGTMERADRISGTYLNGMTYWGGIDYIEAFGGFPVKLSQDFIPQGGNKFQVNYNTWENSQILKIRDTLFYTIDTD